VIGTDNGTGFSSGPCFAEEADSVKWLKKLFGKLTSGTETSAAETTETPTAPAKQEPAEEKSAADEPAAEPAVEEKPADAAADEPAEAEQPAAEATDPAMSTLDDGVFTDDTPTGQIITQPDADETPTSEIPAQSKAAMAAADDADVTAPRAVNEPYGPGSAKALAGGAAPSNDFTVKGKVASKLFHTKESANFGRLKADVWFKTAQDAEKAGFTAWNKKTKAAPKKAAAEENGAAAPAAADTAALHGEGSAKPNADGTAPSEEYTVKAKVSSKLFHTKESANFGRLKADVWFKTAEDAEKAGFTAWNAKAKAAKK
jgi:uncharacterized protein YccT (UPF0319 family)